MVALGERPVRPCQHMKSFAVKNIKNCHGLMSIFSASARKILMVAMAFSALSFASSAPASAAPTYAGIVIDAKTGKVLYSENADSLRYPASLTKMMTLYLTFEALESGKISLNSRVPVSANAAAEPPSKLGVGAGRSVTVEQAILALVTRSANDIATALGEYLGGSEARFAKMMTAKARSLGMSKTTYRNANGLPNTAQMTTARDQARLGIALRQHFPQYYGYFSTRSFKFGKQVIGNHNRLLGAVRGVDGIKTGYTRAAGFNLVTSAQADGRSIVGVVMGSSSGGKRNETMKQLVLRYLPKASRSGSGDFVLARSETTIAPESPVAAAPSAAAASASASAVDLPSRGPLPEIRYQPAGMQTAYASTGGASPALEAVTAPVAAPPAAALPVPEPAPAYMPESSLKTGRVSNEQASLEPVAAPAPAAEEIDNTVTASTPKAPAGWVIQIGAAADKKLAMELLRKAQDKGGKVLRSASPFTVAYGSGSAQVHRARFGGFADQKAAVNACKALKSKGFGCWASLQ
ncbi:D-alanyl-D-alanine carboxypeptidase [Ciceribacter ferrooxidans]|uniref:D-alanyl-D-alanine carboxypeptidase n=2 Tax=Ciceribacter ferrooxidans TaxID=2509717 RepID=A0A4V1RRW8_9HYPH|nr:D-alanyl-D-alanine carboxypeptidase [Ciceribacter ferrooxidans]